MELHEYSELTLIKALPETYILTKDSGLYSIFDIADSIIDLEYDGAATPIEEQKANETLKDMLVRFYSKIMDEDIAIDLANEDYNEKKAKVMNIPNWIDINKEHPMYHKDTHVLVYMPKAYTKISVVMVYNDGKGGSCFNKGWNKGEGNFEVTHWMPLPKPPMKGD